MELRAWYSAEPTAAIGEALGLAYYRLSEEAETDDLEAAYLNLAKQVFLDVVAHGPPTSGAYLMLSIIDDEPIESRLAWMRKASAVDSDHTTVGFLISELTNLNTREGYLEAIEVADRGYSNAAVGPDKWARAERTYQTYRLASWFQPGMVDPDEFVSRVRDDSHWDDVLRIIAEPALEPGAAQPALETACRLTGVFGREPCMAGIEAAATAALSAEHGRDARVLADTAATGMRVVPRASSIVEGREDFETRFEGWLTKFIETELDSDVVLDAIARIVASPDRRLKARRALVARNPEDGRARFELGKMYYDRSHWAEAQEQLELARALFPADDEIQILIGQYLRQAEYEIGNN